MELSTQVVHALQAVCATEIAEVPGFLRDFPCESVEALGLVHNSTNARLEGAVMIARMLAPGHISDIEAIRDEAVMRLADIYEAARRAIDAKEVYHA